MAIEIIAALEAKSNATDVGDLTVARQQVSGSQY